MSSELGSDVNSTNTPVVPAQDQELIAAKNYRTNLIVLIVLRLIFGVGGYTLATSIRDGLNGIWLLFVVVVISNIVAIIKPKNKINKNILFVSSLLEVVLGIFISLLIVSKIMNYHIEDDITGFPLLAPAFWVLLALCALISLVGIGSYSAIVTRPKK